MPVPTNEVYYIALYGDVTHPCSYCGQRSDFVRRVRGRQEGSYLCSNCCYEKQVRENMVEVKKDDKHE